MALAVAGTGADLATTTNSIAYTSGLFTPADNALIVVMVNANATIVDLGVSDSVDGTTGWVQQLSGTMRSGVEIGCIYTKQFGAGSAAITVIFNCFPDTATGCMMAIFQVTGHNQTTPVVQVSNIAQGDASSQPTITFGSALGAANCYMGMAVNNGVMTGNTPASWTSIANDSYSSPNNGRDASYRVGGESGTTISWPNATTNWDALGIEILGSAAVTATATWREVGVGSANGSLMLAATYRLMSVVAKAASLTKLATYKYKLTTLSSPFIYPVSLAASYRWIADLTRGFGKEIAVSASYRFSGALTFFKPISVFADATYKFASTVAHPSALVLIAAAYRFGAALGGSLHTLLLDASMLFRGSVSRASTSALSALYGMVSFFPNTFTIAVAATWNALGSATQWFRQFIYPFVGEAGGIPLTKPRRGWRKRPPPQLR